jgi:hypothetical protein
MADKQRKLSQSGKFGHNLKVDDLFDCLCSLLNSCNKFEICFRNETFFWLIQGMFLVEVMKQEETQT